LSATERETPRIQEWRHRFLEFAKKLDPLRPVFVDEAGSNIGMTRDYALAPCGERAPGYVPRNRGNVTTMLGALDIRGVRALMTVEGGTDADVFEAFLEHVLVPTLRPGDIVILLCWSKLKAALEDFGARPVEDLHQAIRRAMDLVCADDAMDWFTHCGYGAPGM
jgi:hypothetical protein